jgi:phosphatidylserine decarboxylase
MKFKTCLQYIVPHHFLSRLMGFLTRCQQPTVKNWAINKFIKKYNVDMRDAIITDPSQYPDFNSFFTRHLKSSARPIVTGIEDIACPVDGSVSQLGTVNNDRIFQAKGFDFDLLSLLGGRTNDAALFTAGQFITLYLAPKDYHRIHMPVAGKLLSMTHVPGHLFSVNPTTVERVPRLFARNERIICLFETAIGPMALILVGAFFVASINTVWAGEISPPQQQQIRHWSYQDTIFLERGKEMGHFKLGSTVIVLFGHESMAWAQGLGVSSSVKMGELIGTIRS